MHYEYCPHCGQKLVDRQAGDDGLIPYCNSCKKYWFDTFASCVIILIYNEQDEVMLCRQEYLSKEYEVITSGFIIPGETAEAAALREVKEELGLDLEELEYAGTHWFGRGDMLMHCFMGFTHKKEPVLSPKSTPPIGCLFCNCRKPLSRIARKMPFSHLPEAAQETGLSCERIREYTVRL